MVPAISASNFFGNWFEKFSDVNTQLVGHFFHETESRAVFSAKRTRKVRALHLEFFREPRVRKSSVSKDSIDVVCEC